MVKLEIQKSGYSGLTPSGVVLTGGGAATANFVDIAKQELGMPVRLGMPQGATGLIDEIASPAFASSLGLVIYGTSFTTKDVRIPMLGKIEFKGLFNKGFSLIKSVLP